ncbi:SLC13 family permease [soil metagenome]
MTLDIAIAFAILAGAFVLFVIDRFPVDFTAFSVMATILVLGPVLGVTPEEAISGFSNPATITVLAMFILSGGIRRTGAVDLLSQRMITIAGHGPLRQQLTVQSIVAPVSAFINNTAAVAILIPSIMKLSQETGRSPSKLLIPLSYTAQLAGVVTLIGTSTNILASQMMAQSGYNQFHMFEFAHIGLLVLLTGSIYMITIGHRLLPDRNPSATAVPPAQKVYHRVKLSPLSSSPLAGKRLVDSGFMRALDIRRLELQRSEEQIGYQPGGGEALLLRREPVTFAPVPIEHSVIQARDTEPEPFRTRKIPIALAIIAGVVGLAAFGQPILVTAIAGCVLMVVTGCLRVDELHESIRWDVIFLLAGMIPVGVMLERTGAALLLANLASDSATYVPPIAILFIFYGLTMLMTELISNNAAVVLMVPVGVPAAITLGVDPTAIVLAIMFAASASFATPIGYQTNAMVYGIGGYKFTDFFKVGGGLNLLLLIATPLYIYFLWGL